MKNKTMNWITGIMLLILVLLASLSANELLMLLTGSFLEGMGIKEPLLQNAIILITAITIIFLLNKKFDLKKLFV